MNDIPIGVWTILGTIIVAAISVLGTIIVNRLSSKVAKGTNEVASQKEATDAWARYSEKMEARVEKLEKRSDVQEARIAVLEANADIDTSIIRRLLAWSRLLVEEIVRTGGLVPTVDHSIEQVAELRLNPPVPPVPPHA